MLSAIIAEVFALITAVGTIPVLRAPVPVVWMLSATAMLSAGGVVLVTVYFLRQYSRRPLNEVQQGEIEETLRAYMPRDELSREFVSDSRLKGLVDGLELFWLLRYWGSVVEFAEASRRLERLPGYIIIAELENPTEPTKRVLFDLVEPPVASAGVPSGSTGNALPASDTAFGALFEPEPTTLILYLATNYEVKVLKTDPARPAVFYNNGLTAPTLGPADPESPMPRLTRNTRTRKQYKWRWVS